MGAELVEKLTLYFEQNAKQLELKSSMEMGYLLTILPANLKCQLAKFLNRDAIEAVPFLQDRSDTFYLNYLEKLTPMAFERSDVLFTKGQAPKAVFISLGGQIRNTGTNKIF